MASVKVGDGDAKIGKIVLTISKCAGYATLDTKWTKLAQVLETNAIDVSAWKKSLRLENDTLDDIIEKLLMDWVNRKSNNATILNLENAFKEVELEDIGKVVMTKFGNSGHAASDNLKSSSNASASQTTVHFENPMQILLSQLTHFVDDSEAKLDEKDGNCASNQQKGGDVVDLRTSKYLSDLEIVKPKTAMCFGKDFYKLPIQNKGLALILNIIEYKGIKFLRRKGAHLDSTYMFNVWTQLGYDVQLEDKGTFDKARVEQIIKEFCKKCNVAKPESVVVFLGGHGAHDKLYMSTEKDYLHLYKDIVLQFGQSKCLGLAGKPKMFMISACQEFATDSSSLFPADTDASQKLELEHTIVAYSTLPGYFSTRYQYLGTAYTYCLTRVMIAEAHRSHFKKILEKVEDMMRDIKTSVPIDQQPNYRHFGFKKLYFNLETESPAAI